MSIVAERRARLGRIVGGVLRQAVHDARADGVRLLEASWPEAELAHEWCVAALGADRVSTGTNVGVWLGVHPVCKTALLLGEVPAAELLPLGDLYASEVRQLAGGWSPSARIRQLSAQAGGDDALDGALRRWAEDRVAAARAVAALPGPAALDVAEAIELGRFARARVGLVPKLTTRTLGIDFWE